MSTVKPSSKWRTALGIALLAAIGFVVATKIGHKAGADAAALARDRLQLVWPSLMTMPEEDRALIVGLAMTCELERQPLEPRDVVACLRSAAADPHAMLPKGVDQARAQARLEQLLPQRI